MNEPTAKPLKIKVKRAFVNRKLSNITINLFKFLNVFLILDFGFLNFKSHTAKLYMKIFSLIQLIVRSTICIISFYYRFGTVFVFLCLLCLFQHVTYVLIRMFSKHKKTFYNFQNDLLTVDAEIDVDSSCYKLDIKIMMSILITLICRFITCHLFCITFNSDCSGVTYLHFILYFWQFSINDVLITVYTLVFYSVYCRVKKFTDFVNKAVETVACEYIYKSMINSTDAVVKLFETTFAVMLAVNALMLMLVVFITMAKLRNYLLAFNSTGIRVPRNTLGSIVLVILAVLTIFLPSLFAGKLVSQVDELKLVLHSKLVQARDDRKIRDLKRFIRYIELRPFKFTIYRVVPVDWTLPVIIINICLTYMIVIIQFTNMY